MKTITDGQRQLIHAVVAEGLSSLPAGVLEKDVLMTEVLASLAELASLDFPLVFCGGTCLSKAHGLIQRMSEDLDFKLLVPQELSRSARSRQLSHMKQALAGLFSANGFYVPADSITASDENNYFSLMLGYQSTFARVVSLRAEIQLEFTVRPVVLATQRLPVRSLLAVSAGLSTQAFELTCVGIEETLTEKILSVLRRTAQWLAGRNRADFDPRLARHLYDVHQIVRAHRELASALRPGLFATLVAADTSRFARQHPEFAKDPVAEMARALAAVRTDPLFREHYDRVLDDLVFGEAVAFDAALTAFEGVATGLLAQLADSK